MSKQIIYSGNWLKLINIDFNNKQYQYVQRIDNTKAVVIIAIKQSHIYGRKYQLILQDRPTFDTYILQFPAGLIDKMQTIECAALRQLKQETGYSGVVKKVSNASPSSAGLSTELLYFVTIQITEQDKVQLNDQNNNIVILPLMTKSEIIDYIGNTNYLISSRVYCYFMN